jgi:predicted enzyme related to lactoylglutathione lyase
MGIVSHDIGLVSTSPDLIGFYAAALGGTPLEPRVFDWTTIHRLDLGPVVLKVMVPVAAPAPAPAAEHFSDVTGLRYLTFWVDDLDDLVARWTAAGGTVTIPVGDLRPGVRFALLADPDGNAVEALEQQPS